MMLPEWPEPPAPYAYTGLAGEIVRTLSPQSEADPVALLMQSLIAFGSIAGRTAHVAVGATKHFANEFAVLVGDTSAGRKGQSWRDTRQCIAPADPNWDRGCILGGLSSGEGVIYHVRDAIHGTEPIREKKKITGYQEITIDPGVEDKRLLILEPEFGGVLQVMRRDGNKLSAVIRQAWDGDTLACLTKGSPHKATGAHISLVGHVTSDELIRLLSDCDQANGFANRILWCCVRRSKLLPFGGQPDADELSRLQSRVRDAAAFARTLDRVEWGPEARSEWNDAYRKLTAPRLGSYGRATSRAEAHTVRLAMLYALMDRSDRIESTHLRAAIALWDYCERSAAYLFGGSLGDRDALSILEALRDSPAGLSRSQIRAEVFHHNKTASHVEAKLALLLQSRLARREKTQTGGRPVERWFAEGCLPENPKSPISPPTPAIHGWQAIAS